MNPSAAASSVSIWQPRPLEQRDLIRRNENGERIAALRAAMRAHVERLPEHTRHDPGVATSDQNMPENVHPGHRHPHNVQLGNQQAHMNIINH